MRETEVLIVGAGPTGMISALSLAKLGVPCIVIERNNSVSTHPKAHELNARSIEILKSLGISLEELQAEASPFSDGSRILFCHSINEEYGRIDLMDDEHRRAKYKEHLDSDHPYLNISQTEIEKIILSHVMAHPLIDVLYHHQWTDLDDNGQSVISQVVDLQSDKSLVIKSKFLIAADGAGSRCRKSLDIRMEGPDHLQDFVSAYFEFNLRDFVNTPAKLYWILNPEAPGTLISHHIEKRWVYMVPIFLKYQNKEDFRRSFLEEKIKIALGAPDLDISVLSIDFWRMSAQIANTYRKGRVLLAGDAAHRFPPTGGLGMNTGAGDAHNIAWKIKLLLDEKACMNLLDSYESERRPIAIQNKDESLHNYHKILEVLEAFGLNRKGWEILAKIKASIPFKWLPLSIKAKLIDFATLMADRKMKKYYSDERIRNKVRSAIQEQIGHFDRIGLDIGYIYESGALISDGSVPPSPDDPVTEYIPNTCPGARFPHMRLETAGGTLSTLDFLNYEYFVLLIREQGQVWLQDLQGFTNDLKSIIKVVQLDHLQLNTGSFEALISLCEIDNTGAILIRPDGHIAFRIQHRNAITGENILSKVIQKILCQNSLSTI